MGREYPAALDMFVNRQRCFIDALQNNKDLSIVIHGTGSPGGPPSAQAIAEYFASNSAMVSSHFVIGRDGTVVQCVSLTDGAGANCCLENGHDTFWDHYENVYKNLNLCTISIEHCNDVSNSLAPTPAQLAASKALVSWLQEKYAIPSTRIKTHASIDPITRKECPGNYPMSELTTPAPQPKQPKNAAAIAKMKADLEKLQADEAVIAAELQNDTAEVKDAEQQLVQITQPTVIG